MESIPAEVIMHVLEYLSFDDRRQMALLNTTWYYATTHPTFSKNELFKYDELKYNRLLNLEENQKNNTENFDAFKKMLLNSKKKLFNLSFRGLSYAHNFNIFTDIGDRIKSLHLVDLHWLKNSILDPISNHCNNLELLELNNISHIFISKKARKPIISLNSITFNSLKITDMEFNIFMQCAPNLKELGLYDCTILNNPKIVRRFYPNYENNEISSYNSDYVFTTVNVVSYLRTTKNLNSLMLKGNCDLFIELPSNIKLKKLILDGSHSVFLSEKNSIDAKTLDKLLGEQKSLEHLEITNFHCCIVMAVSKLHNLKHLKLDFHIGANKNCYTDKCIETFLRSLCKMEDLESFFLSPFHNNIWPIANVPDSVFSSLTSLDCLIGDALKVIHLGKKLTSLRIRNGSILKGRDLELLFNTQTNLKHLWIDNCIALDENILSWSPISNLKGLISLNISGSKLTYRCLQYFKFSYLKSLTINKLSVGACLKWKDFTDFEHSLKQFGRFVPALTTCQLTIPKEEAEWIRDLHWELCESTSKPFEMFKPYFNKLRSFELIFPPTD